MLYDLSNELSRKQFAARVKHIWAKGGIVELTDKSRRSLSQNAYLHAILGVLALETGNSLEVVKREIYKKKVNPDLFVRIKHDPMLGEIEEVRSSRDLTKEEMSLSLDRYKKFCADNGIFLPEPGDEELLRQIEFEMARAAKYM